MDKTTKSNVKMAAIMALFFVIVLLLLYAGDEYDIPGLKQAYDVLN